ncbi:MAG: long-chain-acyl-CoA synthetase [Polyangiaceae bacterium]
MDAKTMIERFKLPKFSPGVGRTIASNLTGRVKGALGILFLDLETVMSPALELEGWAEKTPDRVFLRFEGEDTTYREMRDRVERRATTLKRAGVRWGDVVAIVMHNHPEYIVTVLALSWLGATSSLINTSLTGASLAHAIFQTGPRGVVAGRDLIAAVDDAIGADDRGASLLRFFEETRPSGASAEHGGPATDAPDREGASSQATWHRLRALEAAHSARDAGGVGARRAARCVGGELFAYIFTSGTTGLPKGGKILNARALTAALGFGMFTLGLTQEDVLYVCLPLFHASGLAIGVGSTLKTGATLALARKLSVSRFWDDLADTGATAFVYIGEICRYLLASPPHPREREHRVTRIVGNGMRPDVWPKFVERFQTGVVHEFYAATEGNVNMMNLFGVEGSVGRMPPLPQLDNAFLARFDQDTEMPVRDKKGRCIRCKPGEVGELLGRIDDKYVTSRFDGYVGEEATKAKIIRDVEKKGDAFFRSGDLMRKDVFGFYYFVDRIGDTFRWKGENVATTEVQDAIGKFAPVESANVFGVTIPGTDGRAGMAALAFKPGAHFAPEAFYEHVAALLPAYAVPAFVRLLPEAAVTMTFKLKKTDMVRDGFDPSKTRDLIFFRDDRRRSYEPVDADVHAKILSGAIRF